MHKKILLFIPIIILIISTAYTKNSTKKLDKQIFEIQEDIRALNDIYEIVLDVKIIVIIKKIKKINDIRSKDIFKFDLFASYLKFSSILFIIKFKNF